MSNSRSIGMGIGVVVTTALFALAAHAAKPDDTVISGKLIDMTCAAKGMVMMGSDYNALNDDHKTPDGLKKDCATMCLKGGQPAGVYRDGKIVATLLANPSVNLYKYAAEDVDILGFWAGKSANDVATFVPKKIRKQGDSGWTEVKTKVMHE